MGNTRSESCSPRLFSIQKPTNKVFNLRDEVIGMYLEHALLLVERF